MPYTETLLKKRSLALMPLWIALLGGFATVWITWFTMQQIDRDARNRLQTHALSFQSAIESRLQSYENLLLGVAALFQATEQVTQEQFENYARELDIETQFDAVGSLNYAEYVPASERQAFMDAFIKEISATRQETALLLEPGHSEYMVITRAYPRRSARLGFNVFRNLHPVKEKLPVQRLSQLYAPRNVVSSGMPIRPLGKGTNALAARVGIFKPGPDGTPRLRGTVGLGFNIERFFRRVALPKILQDARFHVDTIGRKDGSLLAQPVSLYTNFAAARDSVSSHSLWDQVYSTGFTVSFGDASLRVQVEEEKSALVSQRDTFLPAIAFTTGLLLTILGTALYMNILNRNKELQQAITRKIADLQRENERSRQLERELTHVAEEERRRIGHELHDDLGQRLTGVSLSAQALYATLKPILPVLSGYAASIEQQASGAIASVRGLAHGLMPVPPEPQGLRDALEDLSLSVASLHNVRCIFDFDDPVNIDDQDIAANLYRIAQEAVNNAIRHAQASVVNIRLDYNDDKIALSIADNGIGFEQDELVRSQSSFMSGAGLRIMSYRAAVINFTLTVKSSAGQGTTITVQEC